MIVCIYIHTVHALQRKTRSTPLLLLETVEECVS